MSNQTALEPSNPSNTRGIIAFPAIDEFYNELMDRLQMVVDLYLDLDEKSTIFINILPRDHAVGTKIYMDRFKFTYLDPSIKPGFRYGGTSRQREFLEGQNEKDHITKLGKSWEALINKNKNALGETESKVSFRLFKEFREKDFSLNDIPEKCTGTLTDYFKAKLQPELKLPPLTEEQEAEYEILDYHFDILSYRYLSLPLIQFAEFDGVAHIILSETDYENNFLDKDGKFREREASKIIKAFSREYEDLILDWDIVGAAKLKNEAFLDALDPEKFYSGNSNEILIELGYEDYYQKHRSYFRDRLTYSARIPDSLQDLYRQVAIIHVLIDSYAHNISAHSLTALEWWFRQRADLIDQKKEAEKEGKPHPMPPADMNPNIALLEHYDTALDKEIHPLLRFLLDKGAFWTGLTRDNSFGGRIINLHNVLWRDFINNPLYLGTIAFSEGIAKVHINITFLSYLSQEEDMLIKKKVDLDGHYATVDLTRFYPNKDKHQHLSNFVVHGADFEKIKKRLIDFDYEGFFPGGIVGEHAFFTLLETELRNVKHYKPEELKEIKDQGLTLNISIEEDNYIPENERKRESKMDVHYYKIGVWLKHPLWIDKNLMQLRPEKLYEEIIDEKKSIVDLKELKETDEITFIPKLGGTYQDKVCAAMLFNNTFGSVDDRKSERSKRYYPWLKGGSSAHIEYRTGMEIEDLEISAKRLFSKDEEFRESKRYFEEKVQPHYGYFKKFFFIWKGQYIYDPSKSEALNVDLENISRFRFARIQENDSKALREMREKGIVRVINHEALDEASAYHQWLMKWLSPDQLSSLPYRIVFKKEGGSLVGELELSQKALEFRNRANMKKNVTPNTHNIKLLHKPDQRDEEGEAVTRYRNHGIFKQYFCEGEEPHKAKMDDAIKVANLFEVLATRIDNRLAGRFQEVDTDVLTQQLFCTVYSEDQLKWKREQEKGFNRYHFLVVHLSFIEAFNDENGVKKYSEENIRSFIDQEILKDEEIPENFMLVITTGRGRTHWWEKLRNEHLSARPGEVRPYTSFVTFRPVEALTAAIGHAITIKDDIELKYRLVKVLFGS